MGPFFLGGAPESTVCPVLEEGQEKRAALTATIKYLGKSNLREKGLFGSQFLITNHRCGEVKAAGTGSSQPHHTPVQEQRAVLDASVHFFLHPYTIQDSLPREWFHPQASY